MKTLPIVQQACKIKEITPILDKKINELFQNSYYDRSVYYLETNLNPLEINDPTKYNFDSLVIAKKYGTADCVGIARKIQEELKDLFRLQLIPASTPIARYQANMPKCTHPGLFIWCQDGYVLIDPAMNIPSIMVFQQQSTINLNLGVKGRWQYNLNLEHQKIEVLKNSTIYEKPWSKQRQLDNKFEYYLAEVIEPDLDLTIPHFIFDRNVLICPFTYPSEKCYFINIKLNLQLVEYSCLTFKGLKKILTIPFTVYYDNPKKFENLITLEIANRLKIPRKILISRIITVITRTKCASISK